MSVRAQAILANIKSKKLHTDNLSKEQRRFVVAYLWMEGMGTNDMADTLGVTRQTIYRDKKVLGERFATEFSESDVREIAGVYQKRMNHLARRLIMAGKDSDAARVIDATIARLQSLGILTAAPLKLDLTISPYRRMSDEQLREHRAAQRDREEFAVRGSRTGLGDSPSPS